MAGTAKEFIGRRNRRKKQEVNFTFNILGNNLASNL
jgi:hypothetical protein